jgi:hypothetical protein
MNVKCVESQTGSCIRHFGGIFDAHVKWSRDGKTTCEACRTSTSVQHVLLNSAAYADENFHILLAIMSIGSYVEHVLLNSVPYINEKLCACQANVTCIGVTCRVGLQSRGRKPPAYKGSCERLGIGMGNKEHVRERSIHHPFFECTSVPKGTSHR